MFEPESAPGANVVMDKSHKFELIIGKKLVKSILVVSAIFQNHDQSEQVVVVAQLRQNMLQLVKLWNDLT